MTTYFLPQEIRDGKRPEQGPYHHSAAISLTAGDYVHPNTGQAFIVEAGTVAGTVKFETINGEEGTCYLNPGDVYRGRVGKVFKSGTSEALWEALNARW